MVRIHLLPAREGDCILVEYGDKRSPSRILIDGGTRGTSPQIVRALAGCGPLELIVVTHVDSDHIGGLVALFERGEAPRAADIWFNGYRHLSGLEEFGPVDG